MNYQTKTSLIFALLLTTSQVGTCEWWETAAYVAGGAAVCVAGPYVIVPALGFTSGGITAGSVGAWMMSLSAPVVKGSIVATLQSVGAAGLSWGSTFSFAGAGGAAGAAFDRFFSGPAENDEEGTDGPSGTAETKKDDPLSAVLDAAVNNPDKLEEELKKLPDELLADVNKSIEKVAEGIKKEVMRRKKHNQDTDASDVMKELLSSNIDLKTAVAAAILIRSQQ